MDFTGPYSIICFLSALAMTGAQFAFPYEGGDRCAAAKLIDPFLIQVLKSKYPKKCSAKFGFDKDSVLQAKYKLALGKMLARQWKNINGANCGMQNVMFENPQSMVVQPVFASGQSAGQTLGQPIPMSDLQIPCDALRTVASGYPRIMDQSLLQSDCQLPRSFGLTTPDRAQQIQLPNQYGFSLQQ